jgi:hypothetical protein
VTVVLLHDLGAEEAGEPWRAAAPGDWVIPDLPGHGATPAPRHGAYDPMGPVTIARWALGGTGVVVGVGDNAHGALILAAGRGCESVAIVDGLWRAWEEPDEAIAQMYAGLRAIVQDAGATEPPPSSGLDPRTKHGYGVNMSPSFAQRFWGAVTCPVLAIETPASSTPADEREERVSWFGGPAELIELDPVSEADIVTAVMAWSQTVIG